MILNLPKPYLLAAYFFLITLVIGCKKDDNFSIVVTMKIASKLDKVSPRPPAIANNPAIIYNMNITEMKTNKKYGLDLGQIDGFTYVEGFEYILKVQKTIIKNPPADGFTESFKLIQIISKT